MVSVLAGCSSGWQQHAGCSSWSVQRAGAQVVGSLFAAAASQRQQLGPAEALLLQDYCFYDAAVARLTLTASIRTVRLALVATSMSVGFSATAGASASAGASATAGASAAVGGSAAAGISTASMIWMTAQGECHQGQQ